MKPTQIFCRSKSKRKGLGWSSTLEGKGTVSWFSLNLSAHNEITISAMRHWPLSEKIRGKLIESIYWKLWSLLKKTSTPLFGWYSLTVVQTKLSRWEECSPVGYIGSTPPFLSIWLIDFALLQLPMLSLAAEPVWPMAADKKFIKFSQSTKQCF